MSFIEKGDSSRVQNGSIDAKEARPFFRKKKVVFTESIPSHKEDSSSGYDLSVFYQNELC